MRTSSRLATLAASVVVAGSLAACAQQPRYPEYQSQQPTQVYNNAPVANNQNNQYGTEYGTLSNIETLQSKPRTSGAGAVLGAVVGGVLGNQIGGGSGRAAATVIGAVGGGVAGNAIEGRGNSGGVEGYRLVINLDQGGQRVYEVASPGDLRTGDRVRLNGGQISRM